jgi:ubiquinone/menaquinone biosynthesis C-methylase UbiE
LRDGILHALTAKMSAATDRNEHHYDAMAEQDGDFLKRRAVSRNHQTKMKMVMDRLLLRDVSRPLSVLEFGTGGGMHAAEIVSAGNVYTGLDISEVCLKRALQTYPLLCEALLTLADVGSIPFRDETFDAVFCVAALHHLSEPSEGIRELIRVLVRGGRFCFVEPRRFYPVHFVKYLRNRRVEAGTLKTYPRSIVRFLLELGVDSSVSCCVFTPNSPKALIPLYEAMDAICLRTSLLHPCSVMFCVHNRE